MTEYDKVRDFVDFTPAGFHQGYPDYDAQVRPHRRAKETYLMIDRIPAADYRRLVADGKDQEGAPPNQIGVVIKLHSEEDPTYPGGIWVSYFNPNLPNFPSISRPIGCLANSGTIQAVGQVDEIFIGELINRQFYFLVRAIDQGRVKPLEQNMVGKVAPNTIFRR